MHEQAGITVTINRSAGGGFVAKLPGTAGETVEADSLNGLLENLRGMLAAVVLTPEEREAEGAIEAEAISWEQVKAMIEAEARPLAEEIACYRQHLPEWGNHEGEHVLIKGNMVLSFHATRSEALREGYRQFDRVPFLVKQVRRHETPLTLEWVIR